MNHDVTCTAALAVPHPNHSELPMVPAHNIWQLHLSFLETMHKVLAMPCLDFTPSEPSGSSAL